MKRRKTRQPSHLPWKTGMVLVAICGGFCFAASAMAGELQAGAARVDLTPPQDMEAALGGYGERESKPAEGVHDRIFAKALVVSSGKKRFAMVTADILAFPPPFKAAMVERLSGAGWTSDQIMLLPSHSHTSIDMSAINSKNIMGVKQIGIYQPELLELVLARIEQVVLEASRDLVPVVLGTSTKKLEGWNRNRREGDGSIDPDLTVTRIDTRDGQPLALLFNFTAHPTMMGPEHMQFSGGWPGHAQRTLEALVGGGVTAMYYNGAEGDQSVVGRPDSGPSRWEAAERYGRELGIQVWKTWEATKMARDAALDYHAQPIELPQRTWHDDFLRTGGKEYNLTEALLEKMLPLICPPNSASVSLRLGDLLVVGIPGEMTVGLGLKIKAEAIKAPGIRHVAIGGLADEWISYILSKDEYRAGGYEASVSFYGPTLGKTVVDGALEGVKNLGAMSSEK